MDEQTYETPRVLVLGEFAAETGFGYPDNEDEPFYPQQDWW